MESQEHEELKEKASSLLKALGFSVEVEQKIGNYVVDVFGQRDRTTVVVECGNTLRKKLEELSTQCSVVFHWPFNSSGLIPLNENKSSKEGCRRDISSLLQEVRERKVIAHEVEKFAEGIQEISRKGREKLIRDFVGCVMDMEESYQKEEYLCQIRRYFPIEVEQIMCHPELNNQPGEEFSPEKVRKWKGDPKSIWTGSGLSPDVTPDDIWLGKENTLTREHVNT